MNGPEGAMPGGIDERDYFKQTIDGGVIRIWFRRDRNEILAFTVQLEVWTGEEWRPVVRYDSAHGRPHRDILDRGGRVIRKDWFAAGTSNKEAMRRAINNLVEHAAEYRSAFERRSE